jgi:hypothetical protein
LLLRLNRKDLLENVLFLLHGESENSNKNGIEKTVKRKRMKGGKAVR